MQITSIEIRIIHIGVEYEFTYERTNDRTTVARWDSQSNDWVTIEPDELSSVMAKTVEYLKSLVNLVNTDD